MWYIMGLMSAECPDPAVVANDAYTGGGVMERLARRALQMANQKDRVALGPVHLPTSQLQAWCGEWLYLVVDQVAGALARMKQLNYPSRLVGGVIGVAGLIAGVAREADTPPAIIETMPVTYAKASELPVVTVKRRRPAGGRGGRRAVAPVRDLNCDGDGDMQEIPTGDYVLHRQ